MLRTTLLTLVAFSLMLPVAPAQVLSEETTLQVNETFHKVVDTKGRRSPSGKVYLKFAARIECRWRDGSQPGLDIFVNDVPVSGRRLVNKPSSYPFGEYDVQWYRGDARWSVPYYPWNIGNPPQKYIHEYVFDITDLLRENVADIRIVDIFGAFPNARVELRNLEVSYNDQFPKVEGADEAETRGPLDQWRVKASGFHAGAAVRLSMDNEYRPRVSEPITPKIRVERSYQLETQPDGTIALAIHGERYRLESQFGFPELGWVTPQWKKQGENEWIYENGKARIVRRLVSNDRYVEIQDHVINRTSEDLPIGVLNAVDLENLDSLRQFRICGKAMPSFWVNSAPARGNITPMLPLAYLGREKSGLGLWLTDDIYRHQASFMAIDKKLFAGTDEFYLGPQKEYTFQWRLYPVGRPSYFEVLNAHRASEQLYQEIPGLLGFVYPDQPVDKHLTTAEAVKQFFEETGITVAGMLPTEEVVTKPRLHQFMVYGNETLERIQKSSESPHRVMQLAREAQVSNVRYIVYTDIHLINNRKEPNWLEALGESVIRDEKGRLVPFTNGFLYCVLPKEGTPAAKRFEATIDWYLNEGGYDGIFFDEWPHSRAERSFVASHEDGFSAKITQDFRILRKFGHVALGAKSFQKRLIEKIKTQHPNAVLYANHFDVTQEAAQWPIVHFAEPTQHDDDFLRAAQAGRTPLALNTKHNNSLWSDLQVFLKHGVLMTYYSKRLRGDHILKEVYPITPKEIGPGYVIGENKIITSVSGIYHFHRSRPLKASVFKGPSGTRVREVQGETGETLSRIHLDLAEDEVAVIHELP